MKRALILQHAAFEGPARIAELLVALGYTLDIRSLAGGDAVPSRLAPDELLIMMGGSMGVGDLADPAYPYLQREVALLSRCIADDAPVLGVCLGAQLLAHAAGAAVYPMAGGEARSGRYEVGWAPLTFHVRGDDRVLAGMPAETPMLHWHGDTFDLPHGARLLASTSVCRNQAFMLGSRQFGLQFHCESSPADIETFLRFDAEFVVKANGPDGVERVRSDTALYIGSYRRVGDQLLLNILHAMLAT
jgi:GMP synthase (glutamine-hydrolysing)